MFTAIFAVEIILKYLARGGIRFFSDPWKKFDVVVVLGSFTGQLLHEVFAFHHIKLPRALRQLFLVLRLFRLTKIVSEVRIFKCIVHCILVILPSLFAYAAILLILYYIFACIGMELFYGLFKAPERNNYSIPNPCNNELLNGSQFVALHYCVFNFNDVVNSFRLLFVITIGNNWQILVSGFTAVTHKSYRIFFLFIHWLCSLLVLNIVLAFIIEAFLIEYDPHASAFEAFIATCLKELNVDAEIELSSRGFAEIKNNHFFVTHAQLDIVFPQDISVKPFTTFVFVNDTISYELLMFRMFESEIEAIANKKKRYQGLNIKQTSNGL